MSFCIYCRVLIHPVCKPTSLQDKQENKILLNIWMLDHRCHQEETQNIFHFCDWDQTWKGSLDGSVILGLWVIMKTEGKKKKGGLKPLIKWLFSDEQGTLSKKH